MSFLDFLKGNSIVDGYEFVKFSHSTAKNNPGMILREYTRLQTELDPKLKEAKEKLDEAAKEEFDICVPIDFNAKHIFVRSRDQNFSYSMQRYYWPIRMSDQILNKIKNSEEEAKAEMRNTGALDGNILTGKISLETIQDMYNNIPVKRAEYKLLEESYNILKKKSDQIFTESYKFEKQFKRG